MPAIKKKKVLEFSYVPKRLSIYEDLISTYNVRKNVLVVKQYSQRTC